MESFMVRPGGAELAKTVHSISGTVTTVFLFTRLWARKNHKGLWWDDYILTVAWALQLIANGLAGSAPAYGFNIVNGTKRGQDLQFAASTVLYLALAASKAAFMVTLLRLAVSKSLRIMLWSLIVTFPAASAVMGIISWLDLCDAAHDMIPVSGVCVSFDVLRWVHTGYAIFIVFVDVFLACVPWAVISDVFLPKQEKIGVGVSMSIAGLAGVACVARVCVMASLPVPVEGGPLPDWTYGSVTILCISQGEVAIYIIAQALPTIRVMLLGSWASCNSGGSENSGSSRKGSAVGGGLMEDATEDVELVQLPSGRIVLASSEEAQGVRTVPAPAEGGKTTPAGASTRRAAARGSAQRGRGMGDADDDDEVHRIWSEMRLSNKARSMSPSTPRRSQRVSELDRQRQISNVAQQS